MKLVPLAAEYGAYPNKISGMFGKLVYSAVSGLIIFPEQRGSCA